jgi:hypothetical protein
MKVSDSGSGFEHPEPGTYGARCCGLIDLGTQTDEYQGETNVRRKVVITWEIELFMTDGRPYTVSSFYTASLGKKANLRKDLESWRGVAFTEEELKGFELKKLLGATCMLSVIESATGKTKVNAVMKLPKGMKVQDAVNSPVYLSLEPTEFNVEIFNGLSDFFKKKIINSPEYKALSVPPSQGNGEGAPAAGGDDDIPF